MNSSLKSFRFSLGGHVIEAQGDESELFSHNLAFTRFVSTTDAEWFVRFGSRVELPPADAILLSSFVFEEIRSRCFFSLHGEDYYFVMRPENGDDPLAVMRYRRGSSCVDCSAVEDFSALRFALWFAVSMLTMPSSLSFIHSSTVVYRGRAVLFLGESGTGKSTHSRLWLKNIEGVHLLNDDSPLIDVCHNLSASQQLSPQNLTLNTQNSKLNTQNSKLNTQNLILVHGSPWSGKTPCYVPRSFPLAAIVRLSQSPHNAIRRLSVPEAFVAIQPSLPPALVQDEYYADLAVDIVSDVISKVPVYHLECLPDAAAARLCFETVFPTNG